MLGVDASNSDLWNRKRKLITLQMMLIDDETPLTVDGRKVWTCEWILRRERGAYHTIFRELAIEDTCLGLLECHTKICAPEIEISQSIVHVGGSCFRFIFMCVHVVIS